jgi:hypothetical protein
MQVNNIEFVRLVHQLCSIRAIPLSFLPARIRRTMSRVLSSRHICQTNTPIDPLSSKRRLIFSCQIPRG